MRHSHSDFHSHSKETMWTQQHLVEDLQRIGLTEGATVLAHTSLRAVGEIEGGAETLVAAFRETLGAKGTLLVPTFCEDHRDPAEWETPPNDSELERTRDIVPVYAPDSPATTLRSTGMFPEIVRQQPDAECSEHPALSFAAIGANAAYLTQNAPFHYPLGTGSPLARLHQLDGYVLLVGVSHAVNSSVYLGEIWGDAPYVHRARTLKTGAGEWTSMKGSPECSAGFVRIEPLLRNCRVLHHDYIGNAPSQLMRQQAVVSMAIALLQGNASALLCSNPHCAPCALARRFTAEQIR